MISEEKVKMIKKQYPKGTEVEVISMEDFQRVHRGTHGIVELVDDIGTIHVKWDNGSRLGLIVGEDEFRVIKKPKEMEIIELIRLKDLVQKTDDLVIFTHNKETGFNGVAHFLNDGKTIKVFEGDSSGSDDIELNYDEFVEKYEYAQGYEFDNPFKEKKI